MTERRAFLGQVGVALGTVAAAGFVDATTVAGQAASKPAAKPAGQAPAGGALFISVQKTSAECVRAGEACVAHCARELANGNAQMGKCNLSVHDMLAVCSAMLSLASAESALARRLAPVCADACKACSQACFEHQEHWAHGMHLACKACYESCLACEQACRALAA
jgi:Cys-rich four helix bundle protein (predicted Tat secretion target)